MLEETLTSDSKSGRQDKCWRRHLPVTASLGGRTSVGGDTNDSKSGRQNKCWWRHLPVTVSLGGRTSVGGSCVVLRWSGPLEPNNMSQSLTARSSFPSQTWLCCTNTLA